MVYVKCLSFKLLMLPIVYLYLVSTTFSDLYKTLRMYIVQYSLLIISLAIFVFRVKEQRKPYFRHNLYNYIVISYFFLFSYDMSLQGLMSLAGFAKLIGQDLLYLFSFFRCESFVRVARGACGCLSSAVPSAFIKVSNLSYFYKQPFTSNCIFIC